MTGVVAGSAFLYPYRKADAYQGDQQIVVHFEILAPMQMFQMKEGFYKGEELSIRIQPDEGICQRIAMKEPGAGFYMGTMEMDFSYDQHDQETGDAYVRLLEDSLVGDPTLFTRSDAVDESCIYFDKILGLLEEASRNSSLWYPAGTWGPKEADVLINRSHSEWTNPCKNLTHSNLYCKFVSRHLWIVNLKQQTLSNK